MKKIILFFCMFSYRMFAFEYPFDVERINVDFNGICSNQNSIIAYGTGSMILRTTDDGNIWEQIKVAHDSLEIKKIIDLNDNYYGILADNYLVRSIDNGKSWKKVKVSNNSVYDINTTKDKIYLLSDNQVLVYDLDLNYIETLNIDYINSRKKFLLSNNRILIPQDTGKLIIYDVVMKKQIKIIDFKNLGLCTTCIDPFNLSVSGDNIFLTIDSGNVIKSTDEGFTWKQIEHGSKGIGKGMDKDYYFIYSSSFSTSVIGHPVFIKIDSVDQYHLIGENNLDRIVLFKELYISDFIKTNLNTFFAVGRNKTIFKSTDGGGAWLVLSHFPFTGFIGSTFFVNDNLYYNYTNNGIVRKSTNGGDTWLPQITYPETLNQNNIFKLAYFDSLGNGFAYKTYGFSNEFNLMKTTDFGDTFVYENVDSLKMNFSDTHFKSNLIKAESGITILNNMHIGKDYYTTIYRLDDTFNYMDYSILDSIVICAIFQIDGPNYLAIGLERREPGFDDDSFAVRQYWLLNSDSYGKTWSKDKSFGYPGSITSSYRSQNDILFITKNKNPFVPNYYDYSLNHISIDSKKIDLFIYTDSMSYMSGFLDYKGLFLVNGYYYNFQNNNYPNELRNWSKTENIPYTFTDEDSGNRIRFVSGKLNNSRNFYRMIPKDTTTGLSIETQTAFYANPPYPIPAKNYVSCQIFWDQRKDIDLALFKVYNIYGSIVSEGEDISLNKNNSYSGVLTWTPSSDVPVGTYYIKINHGDAVKVVPVVLMR